LKTREAASVAQTQRYAWTGALVVAGFDRNNRVAVFGDADFATDAILLARQRDLLINTIDWAAGQENLINLTPKDSINVFALYSLYVRAYPVWIHIRCAGSGVGSGCHRLDSKAKTRLIFCELF
jgi:hypothetical protein